MTPIEICAVKNLLITYDAMRKLTLEEWGIGRKDYFPKLEHVQALDALDRALHQVSAHGAIHEVK